MSKTDRRVKYTKEMLRKALVSLLREKHISKITIKELCERADINRGTFYSHYVDQYDLVSQTVHEIVADIDRYLDGMSPAEDSDKIKHTIQNLFEYIETNAEIFKTLFSENCGLDFQSIALEWIRGRDLFMLVGAKYDTAFEQKYIYSYAVSGCIGIVREWLCDNEPRSANEVASLVTALVGYGLNAFFMSDVS